MRIWGKEPPTWGRWWQLAVLWLILAAIVVKCLPQQEEERVDRPKGTGCEDAIGG